MESASVENPEADQDRALVNDIKNMLESSEPPLSVECCIYRVPYYLRKLNKQAYTPQVISIGPFHHGDTGLETMEKLKVSYFKRFVQRRPELTVEHLISTIRSLEGKIRLCYSETIQLRSDAFVKMVLVDASFIVEFFYASWSKTWTTEDCKLFDSWVWTKIGSDLILLENQLPFFVVEKFYNFAFASGSNFPSFVEVTFNYFQPENIQKMSPRPNFQIKHFADLLRTFLLPPSEMLSERSSNIGKNLYSASQLHEAGVKFKESSSICLFDLKFKNGVLDIPCLEIAGNTESRYRNLMALEQCHYIRNAYVTDYIGLLDHLIDTDKDVDLLVQNGIIVNFLGDSNAVTTLVNKLNIGIVYKNMNSNYYRLCEDLKAFYADPRHGWKASLRHDYFSTPLRSASTMAAVILLVLTLVQTLCSIISLLKV